MSKSIVYNPTCSICHRRMGEMSGEEFEALVLAEGLKARCFDCDPDSASTAPALFWQWEHGEVFVLGDQGFEIDASWVKSGVMIEIPHTRMGARARACLSSSTYLNKSSKTEVLGEQSNDNEDGASPGAGWLSPLSESLVLPKWVIECWDCIYTRQQSDRRYCSYHHALLIEQYEDGSMGWGNA